MRKTFNVKDYFTPLFIYELHDSVKVTHDPLAKSESENYLEL